MTIRFLASLAGALIATLIVLGGIGVAIVFLLFPAQREVYRTAAFEFTLAPGWWCEPDGTEIVCHPAGTKPYAAIVVIALKYRNDQDNLRAYEEHLIQPQRGGDRTKDDGGLSEVKFVRRKTLGKREWVESLHLGSEIPNFETYYLATATSHVGMLITMSVHKDRTADFVAAMGDMMSSLRTYQR